MLVEIPARLFALPEHRTYEARVDQTTGEVRPASSSWVTTFLMGADAVKVYSDEDPTAQLNGSRDKLAKGQVVDVVARCEAYAPSKGSGIRLAFRHFTEPQA